MSNKLECPACRSYSSDVWHAYEDGEPCPKCGLSAAATLEVLSLRARTNDEYIQEQIGAAVVRADKAETENRDLRDRLRAVRGVLDDEDLSVSTPYQTQ